MASSSSSTTVGSPKVNMDRAESERLRSLRFSWYEVSVIMGVSVKTLQRRAKEWNIATHSDVTDQRLKEIIQEVLNQFPGVGEVMLTGHLNAKGVHVQRSRIRSC